MEERDDYADLSGSPPVSVGRPNFRMSARQAKWAIVGGTLALLGLGGRFAYLGRPYPPGPGVRWDNLKRIEVGMSRPEAEAVIGYPPQSEWPGNSPEWEPPGTRLSLMWSGTECDIWVHLDANGRVIGRQAFGPPPPSWLDRVWKRLGL